MNIAVIGLGKMGEAIAYRLMRAGNVVYGFDINGDSCAIAAHSGVNIVAAITDFAHKNIEVFWLMLPQGELIDTMIHQLKPALSFGSIIIDGGNSKFSDSMRRAQELALSDVFFIDCGTSGGIYGRENGFCLMVGGEKSIYEKITPLLSAVAVPGGYDYMGPSGAGHYVKMIHNGIEYGLMQAYAEGFHLLKNGDFHNLDLEKVASLWNHGSVIRSWLLDLVHNIMQNDQDLNNIRGDVASTGMGKWTVEEAHKRGIPVPVIEESLNVRRWSEKTGGNYATKIVAMLRNQFGGHAVTKK